MKSHPTHIQKFEFRSLNNLRSRMYKLTKQQYQNIIQEEDT